MSDPHCFPDSFSSPELAEIMQRIYRLRKHFKVVLPENLDTFQQRLLHLKASATPADYDLFYEIGIVFAHSPEAITMGELSRELEVPLSTATRTVDWLVNDGYVCRLSDPEDRRIVRVALTEEGKDLYREIHVFFIESVEQFMSGFTREDRQTFLALLTKLLDTLEKRV